MQRPAKNAHEALAALDRERPNLRRGPVGYVAVLDWRESVLEIEPLSLDHLEEAAARDIDTGLAFAAGRALGLFGFVPLAARAEQRVREQRAERQLDVGAVLSSGGNSHSKGRIRRSQLRPVP